MAKQKSFLDSIRDFLSGDEIAPLPDNTLEPVTKRVSLIVHNPRVPAANNQRLNKALEWHDPSKLVENYIGDIRECSYGYANYKVVEEIVVDRFPRKADGFTYGADQFYDAWRTRKGFHEADAVDYDALLAEFEMIRKVDEGKIDEFWLYGFPYAGYYESIMGGPGAFWCNAPALTQTANASRRFIIMGFNYQRGVGEALEAFGHRAESIMKYTFRNQRSDNLWARFWRHEKENPGQAEVGWMHYAPNSERDYDWGNRRLVKSRWRTWRNFPNLEGEPVLCNCTDWGEGDIRAHHKWWFKLLPHVAGSTNGIANNWWTYIMDPNFVE